ncbi:GNAT family N-acetyltransferase [Parafrankia sp. EUN1f]|uniref:GNAT family N-acetyltransferase n=1 Tax=Parafrankia sp. EUN1f TaxID=102897 RepID=UPI00055D853C|nr:GNAT family N-acetyltransferase [Parafrankia sp. EUN1f]
MIKGDLPGGLAVRRPRADDQPRVLAVLDDWWAGFGGDAGSLQRSRLLPRLFFEHFTASSYLVEHADGTVAAFLIGLLSPSQPDVAYIHFVGVDPALRRHGVAAALYRQFFADAARHGRRQVRCITSPGNTISLAFHTALGFRVEPGDLTLDDRTLERDSPSPQGGVTAHRDHDGPGLHRIVFTRPLTGEPPAAQPATASGTTAAHPRPHTSRDLRVCFLGDSFTAGVGDPTRLGWVGRLAAATDPDGLYLTTYNLGIRRDTSTQIHARWKAECLPRLPAGADNRLVLSFGVNDTAIDGQQPRVPLEESVATLHALLTEARPPLPVLVVGPPPGLDETRDVRIRTLDARYAAVCVALDVPYVSVFDTLTALPAWAADLTVGDGVHPGAAGYQILADLVAIPWRSWLDDGDQADGSSAVRG